MTTTTTRPTGTLADLPAHIAEHVPGMFADGILGAPVGFKAITEPGPICLDGCLAPGSSPHSHSILKGWHLVGTSGYVDLDTDGNGIRTGMLYPFPPTPAPEEMSEEAARALAEVVRLAAPDMTPAQVVEVAKPQVVAANTGRIYEWLREVGFEVDSVAREAVFAYASARAGVDYDVFYDAWMAEVPATLPS